MEGVSLRPAFEGQPLDRKQPIFWEHEGNKAVRDGRWKLVQKWRGPWELYDMEADRTELHDLIERTARSRRPARRRLERLGRAGLCRRLARPRSHQLGARHPHQEMKRPLTRRTGGRLLANRPADRAWE